MFGWPPKTSLVAEIDLPPDIQLAQRLAFWMDNAFVVPIIGKRIGWDAIVGMVPVAGDVAMAVVGGYMLWLAWRYQLPQKVLVEMALNIAVDALAGTVPVIGDWVDASFKAHARNAKVLATAYRNQLPPSQVILTMPNPPSRQGQQPVRR
jgi:Domain of unknown function (DUF4112)